MSLVKITYSKLIVVLLVLMATFVTISGLKAFEKPRTAHHTIQHKRVPKQVTNPPVIIGTPTPRPGSPAPNPSTPTPGPDLSTPGGPPAPEPPPITITVPDPSDRGNCMGIHCNDTQVCVPDYSSDTYFSCKWSIHNLNSTTSYEIIPGHCDPISKPPNWGAEGSEHMCVEDMATIIKPSHHCICALGECPQEVLKYCEHDYLYREAKSLVSSVILKSEEMKMNQRCNFELEQELPKAIADYGQRINLYRVVSVLRNASRDGICNRRRLITCQGSNTCGCADGTTQRELIAPSGAYKSYYCYPTSGSCSRDPITVIPQFEEMESRIRNHYGDPSLPAHHDPHGGCLINLCNRVRGNQCV